MVTIIMIVIAKSHSMLPELTYGIKYYELNI